MSILFVPPAGLELPPTQSDGPTKEDMTIPQIIQLNLENGTLLDLMKAARHAARKPQLSFGRNMAIHYGHQQRALVSKPTTFPSFLYEQPTDTDQHLKIIGQFTHGLDLVKPEEDPSLGDSALAELQNSFALKEQAKQSHQITVLPKSSQTSTNLKSNPHLFKSKADRNTAGESFGKSALQAGSSVHPLLSNSAMAPAKGIPLPGYPSEERAAERKRAARLQRQKALRTPLIHLVAHRQVSTDFITNKLGLGGPEVKELISKVCKPWSRDETKWDLKDQSFKELDVWTFHYSDEDRNIVIQRAIGAFDRMRISPNDPIFQRLLEPKDRNQGKSLSKLDHLNKGPVKTSGTPRIKVQQPDESGQNQELVKSKKRKGDEVTTHSARGATAQEESHGIKLGGQESQVNKQPSKGSNKADYGAETEKKNGKKGVVPLSAEFVNDSDDEDGLDEADGLGALSVPQLKDSSHTTKAAHQAQPRPTKSTKEQVPNKTKSRATPNGVKRADLNGTVRIHENTRTKEASTDKRSPANPIVKTEGTEHLPKISKRKAPETGLESRGATKRPRNLSSPHKPSPLGSSPPANASDMDGEGDSSASSTPLIVKRLQNSHQPNGVIGSVSSSACTSLEQNPDGFNDLTQNDTSRTSRATNAQGRAIKQARTNVYTPPTSDSPSPQRQALPQSIIEKAQNFKNKFYPKYRKIFLEVQEMASPTEEKLEKLAKMQERIEILKKEIYDDFAKHKQ